MSGADIAARVIHLVLKQDHASVLQRQLREIDLLMLAGGSADTHLSRMWPRAHARHSIEYCEDLLAHLRAASLEYTVPDRDLEDMCDVAVGMCWDFGDLGGEPGDDERRRSGMCNVTRLVDIIVKFDNLRPWARENLDLRGVRSWYRRVEERVHDPIHHGASPADFHEIRALLSARVGKGD